MKKIVNLSRKGKRKITKISLKIKRRLINKYDKLFNKVDKNEIVTKLKELGIKKGDLLYVHSSLSSLGYVLGGPNTVIQSLREVVGKNGTIVMPTFNYLDPDSLKFDIFNAEKDKCDTGIISEVFRNKKEATRSIHPHVSIAALGAFSKEITEGHERSKTPFGKDTPYHKIIRNNSYILNLGTEHNSFMHYIQEEINFPNLFLKGSYKFRYYKKKVTSSYFKLHHPLSSTYLIRKRKRLLKLDTHEFYVHLYKKIGLKEKGLTKTNKIGKAKVRLISINGLLKNSKSYINYNTKKYKKDYNNLINSWNEKHHQFFKKLEEIKK